MRDWDDARLFLAVARNGTSRAAAKQLGVNQSTISRRLRQLERRGGVQLFERRAKRLFLTDAGLETVEVATRIEEQFALLERRVLGRDTRLSGSIRFTLPDFMTAPVSPMLADFRRRHPNIELEMFVDNGYVSLTHRQADVALRLGTQVPEHLVGRRIARVGSGVYGSAAHTYDCDDLARNDWVRWDEDWRNIPPEKWIDENIPKSRIAARVNTNRAHLELIAAGVGIGLQACYIADADPRVRLLARIGSFSLSLWLLTHEDIRSTARVRAFMSSLGDSLMRDKQRIEGPPM
jgi:DNA-binding transcriptional LysR family regulator